MKRIFVVLTTVGFLSACGGGGGGGSSSSGSTSPTTPTTPTVFASQVTISSDIAKNTYPTSYITTAQTPVIDDTCLLTASSISYPTSYQGAYALPTKPSGQTLASIPLGVSPIDSWASSVIQQNLKNPNVNAGCNTSLHDAFISTLSRIKALGGSYVMVYQWASPNSGTNPTAIVNPNISDADLVWMAQQAKAAGLQIRLELEVNQYGSDGTLMPSGTNLTTQWINQFFVAWSQFALKQAQVANSAGYSAIDASWTGGWDPTRTNPAVSDTVFSNLLTLVSAIRGSFNGKLLFTDNFSVRPPQALINAVDIIQNTINQPYPLPSGLSQYNVTALKQLYVNRLALIKSTYGTKPIQVNIMVESYTNALNYGYLTLQNGAVIQQQNVEVSVHPNVEGYQCYSCNLANLPSADFSVQALAYEAILESIHDNTWGLNFDSVNSTGYWLTDTILPTNNVGIPNLSETIRNKPAESVVYQWWKK